MCLKLSLLNTDIERQFQAIVGQCRLSVWIVCMLNIQILALKTMSPEQLHIYTEETYIHTQLALSNYRTYRNIVDNPDTRKHREAWMYLQSFLSHFGMVSKLLFAPSGNKRANNRARELSEHLETDETSALNNRDARNAVEHLDERMDNWLDAGHKGILESVFEEEKDYAYISPDRWVVRRVFILAESLFITEERDGPKKMEIQPLIDELKRLNGLCYKKLNIEKPYHIIHPNLG